MALYIPHSIFHLARLLYVRPEKFGPYYVHKIFRFIAIFALVTAPEYHAKINLICTYVANFTRASLMPD